MHAHIYTYIKTRTDEVSAHQKNLGENTSCDRLEVDVLITGCEASLWIGEQFASDMQNLFPALRVVAMSANKVIGKLHFCLRDVLINSTSHIERETSY